jgi:hypothetical protein
VAETHSSGAWASTWAWLAAVPPILEVCFIFEARPWPFLSCTATRWIVLSGYIGPGWLCNARRPSHT